MDCQIKTQLLRLVFSKRKTSCFNFPWQKFTHFWGGGIFLSIRSWARQSRGPPKKNPWIPFRPTPTCHSAIRLGGQHHLANELTFAALRGVSWMPSCAGSMRPFLGHGIENLWYLLMATRNPAFHSPVDNMVCISRYLQCCFLHVRWLFGISEASTLCPP